MKKITNKHKLREIFFFAITILAINLIIQNSQAQKLETNKESTIGGKLWAEKIEYNAKQKTMLADGKVRLNINYSDGSITLISDSLAYDFRKKYIRANKPHQGWLNTQGKNLVYFRTIETDLDMQPISGEHIALRQENSSGAFTAQKFKIKKRKNRKNDWVFINARYTKCPICVDKKEKQQAQKTQKNKVQNKKKYLTENTADKNKKKKLAPLWRFDASKVRVENFDNTKRTPFKPSARVHMQNARLSLYGLPVFYSPYFSYPRFGQRASGFLAPIFGSQDAKGYFVSLPVFFAPNKKFDITYLPTFSSTKKDTSRLEIRSAFAFAQQVKKNKPEKKANNTHHFALKVGGSLPHTKIASGSQAKYFAYTEGKWFAPMGFRANAKYNFIGDRDYLYEYGQGIDILSNFAPDRLLDEIKIEHFSRNGYASLTAQQQREFFANPRADANIAPEILYEHSGKFAVTKRAATYWQTQARWRETTKEAQKIINNILPSEKIQQNLISASAILGAQAYLGAGFTANAKTRAIIDYWHLEEGRNKSEAIQILPEAQIGIEGLFADTYKNGNRIIFLKPLVDIYAALDSPLNEHSQKLRGMPQYYGAQTKLGQSLPFNTAIEGGGQRVLAGIETGVKGAKDSYASIFIAPSIQRSIKPNSIDQNNNNRQRNWLGHLVIATKGSWRSNISYAYNASWKMPHFFWLSQNAELAASYKQGNIALYYKELHTDEKKTQKPYEQSLTLTSGVNFFDKWSTNLALGYNFLHEKNPFDNIGLILTYDGACVTFKASYGRKFYNDRKDSDSVSVSFNLNF